MMDFLLVYSISFIGLLFLIVNAFLFNLDSKVRKNVSKIFLWYLILLSVIEICCNVIGIVSLNNNLFVSHLYFGFQFVFLSFLFHSLIENEWVKKLILGITIFQLGYLIIYYSMNPSLFWVFNTYEIVSTSVLLIIYIIYFLFNSIEIKHNYFNFCIGLMLYLSCSIAIFLSGNLELVLIEKPYIDIWVFNSIFYIVFQIFIFREYLFLKRKIKSIN